MHFFWKSEGGVPLLFIKERSGSGTPFFWQGAGAERHSKKTGALNTLPITNEVCPHWFGHNSRLVIGISWEFFTLGISRIDKLFNSWDFLSHAARFLQNSRFLIIYIFAGFREIFYDISKISRQKMCHFRFLKISRRQDFQTQNFSTRFFILILTPLDKILGNFNWYFVH